MPEPITAPMRQFLTWVSEQPRFYADVMEVWRTSCPRLSVWEDASIAGLVRLHGRAVSLTPAGRAALCVREPVD